MSEKLCLQWNDFQENIKSAFGSLREDTDFADVTLACEDGQQVEAHKVILAASSPFFQKLLGRNKHPHPLIYMRGMKSEDLLAIVDFLYRGEANVFQENLDSFLAIAEELQLKGLMGKTDEKVEDYVLNLVFATRNPNKFNLGEYGMSIAIEENKIVVDTLKWNGLAKKAGFETGDFISELKIENLDRPSKKIIYPLAILLLLIFGYLNYRRKK